tara:strand:- start:4059 stop:4244 length:186 start_codon:yes stop_codon:yes gene_type:complete
MDPFFLHSIENKGRLTYYKVNHPKFSTKKEAASWFKKLKKDKLLGPGYYTLVNKLSTTRIK